MLLSSESRASTWSPGARSWTGCPSASTVAPTSAVRFVAVSARPRGTTSGRACSECGATNVSAMASSPQTSTGPPFERLYAVDPEGVEQISPSHGKAPRSSPPIAQPSSIMRPSVELVTTTSLTARQVPPPADASSAGSSTTSNSPANARPTPASSSSAPADARKPTRPKLTPNTGTAVPRNVFSARSIVPSPPNTTARSAELTSPAAPSPCFATSSSGSTSSTSRSRASARRRSSGSRTVSARPCVITAARRTSGRCVVNPVLELIGNLRPLALHEVQEELAVPLRAGQAGVYDAAHLRFPRPRYVRHLAQHSAPDPAVAHHAAPRLATRRLELRLHEHDGLPARRRELERGRQRLPHGDERDVADEELRRERQLPQRAHVQPLEHRYARVVPDARVQLPVPDVERDHPCCAALQEHVGEAAGRGPDVEAAAPVRVDSERVERMSELLPPSRDLQRRLRDRQLGRLFDLLPRLLIAGDTPRQYQRLRLRAALREPALHEQHVEALLQEATEITASQASSDAT